MPNNEVAGKGDPRQSRNYGGLTGIQMAKKAVAIAGGHGWCDEHKESFADHDHAPEFEGILERDGFGPSVYDDDFEWDSE